MPKDYASTSVVEDMYDANEAKKHGLSSTGRKKSSPYADTSYYTVHGKTPDVEKYLSNKNYPKEMFRGYTQPAYRGNSEE